MSAPPVPAPTHGPVPQTALVTGGAGALGFAIGERLAAGGCRVALVDICDSVGERANALPGAIGLRTNLADYDEVGAAHEAARDALGPIGIVVHCAGIATVSPFLETEIGAFERILGVNLSSGFLIFQRAAQDLVQGGCAGRFIAITSVSGSRAGVGRTAYGTSKAALSHLMTQIALELGPYGITANSIAPGPVDTPLSRDAHTAEARADYLRSIPAGRYGTASEIAAAAAFLASGDAGYINGQTLFVDGGYMASGMGVSIAQNAAAIHRHPYNGD